MDPTKIVGAGESRKKYDFYPTPKECTYALCDFLAGSLHGARVWEPACGEGDMVNALKDRGLEVIGTDIQEGVDFLTTGVPIGCDWIITNPPFSLSEEFILRAKETGLPFAFLLKSQYWHSKKRYSLFQKCRPSYILPLTWRPDFTGGGASLMDVIWCVWLWRDPKRTVFLPLERPEKSSSRTGAR